VNEQALTTTAAENFAAIIASLAGGEPHLEPAPSAAPPVWVLRVAVQGALEGAVSLACPADDAERLATQMRDTAGSAPERTTEDCLRDITRQVAGALNAAAQDDGLRFTAGDSMLSQEPPPAADWLALVAGGLRVRLAVWAALSPGRSTVASSMLAASAGDRSQVGSAEANGVPANLDLILDIELPLWVRFGESVMTLDALSKLGPGGTLDLGRSPDDPVDVLVNNTVVARGEVVAVAGNYGVRVTEVVSTVDRIRSMVA
jgi:flagellar motor switch protein FliN/FliY